VSHEAQFRRAFEAALRRRVSLLAYMASMMRSGVPDEYLLYEGRSYWLELKAIVDWPKGLDANVLAHRFTGPQLAYMRRVDAGGGRGLGVVGFGDPWACVVVRVHNLGADGTLTRRQIERHRVLPLDTWFADRFLNLITRS
jgi:hypothetical protein